MRRGDAAGDGEAGEDVMWAQCFAHKGYTSHYWIDNGKAGKVDTLCGVLVFADKGELFIPSFSMMDSRCKRCEKALVQREKAIRKREKKA